MRIKDKRKISGKAVQTINFDKEVLKAIEDKALKEGSTASFIVNSLCRQIVLSDEAWHRYKAKEHYVEFQKHKFLADSKEVE
jgi:exopolysaccharide biosynthesis protein